MPEESYAPGSILNENQVKSDSESGQSDRLPHQQPEITTSTSLCMNRVSQCEGDYKDESERENPYRILVENASDAIVVHNDGRFLHANSAALLLVGAHDFKQFAFNTVLDFFREEEREQSAERIRAAMELNRLPIREARLRRLDDEEITVEFHTTAIDFQGARAIQTILYDISERKQAEEEIRSLARFPSENPNPVLRVAAEGHLLYANAASEPLLTKWGCKVGACLPDQWIRHAGETLATKAVREVEFVCGENRIFSCILAPVPEGAYITTGADITGIKKGQIVLEERFNERTKELEKSATQLRALALELAGAEDRGRASPPNCL
jgi:PAS domain S-box-containing protein